MDFSRQQAGKRNFSSSYSRCLHRYGGNLIANNLQTKACNELRTFTRILRGKIHKVGSLCHISANPWGRACYYNSY